MARDFGSTNKGALMMTEMTEFFRRRNTCRLCDSTSLSLVLPISPSPIADAFVSAGKKGEHQPLAPLDLYQCDACGHVQNLDIVNPELLFRDYIFHTSNSKGLVDHFEQYASSVASEFLIGPGDLCVEIGSNDGTLLRFLKEKGLHVVGVDPALEIARHATETGIPTIPDFFSADLADRIKAEHGPAKLIVANNVFAHTDALNDVTAGIAALLGTNGIFIFEVSYLLDIVDNFVFDTVYHEHLSYHSIKPFKQFFSRHGLHLFDVRRVSNKGGSIRGFVQRIGGLQQESPIVESMINEEDRRGLHSPDIFKDYETKILDRKNELIDFLDWARKAGKKVVGYGASTTVTTLMYHFDLVDRLDYLIDDNPIKHGLFSPGCHLEVKPSTALYEEHPDVVVVLAWQYAKPIMLKHEKFTTLGGQFVVPLPRLQVTP